MFSVCRLFLHLLTLTRKPSWASLWAFQCWTPCRRGWEGKSRRVWSPPPRSASPSWRPLSCFWPVQRLGFSLKTNLWVSLSALVSSRKDGERRRSRSAIMEKDMFSKKCSFCVEELISFAFAKYSTSYNSPMNQKYPTHWSQPDGSQLTWAWPTFSKETCILWHFVLNDLCHWWNF